MRQVVLDTETTGLEADKGHRIIEVGCVELFNRRPTGKHFWHYLNPDRDSDAGALAVHGLTTQFLASKPRFHEIATPLWEYLQGSELLIHNANFDLGFLHREFQRCGIDAPITSICSVTDTVQLARRLNPGQKVGLDALCRRYGIDNSHRNLHGALLDAQLLAEVYLAMTGGQSRLRLDSDAGAVHAARQSRVLDHLRATVGALEHLSAEVSASEMQAHQTRLQEIAKKAKKLIWSNDLPVAKE